MDVFFEQIIKIKLSGKAKALIALIIFADFLIIAGILLVSLTYLSRYISFVFLVVVGVIWGSVKLISQVSVEYEYIFINGDLDVDKIVAKSSRKRVVSISCSQVEKYGVYSGQPAPGSVKKTYLLCNEDSENQVYMIVPHKAEGTVMIVMAPDERVREAIEKAIPRLAK